MQISFRRAFNWTKGNGEHNLDVISFLKASLFDYDKEWFFFQELGRAFARVFPLALHFIHNTVISVSGSFVKQQIFQLIMHLGIYLSAGKMELFIISDESFERTTTHCLLSLSQSKGFLTLHIERAFELFTQEFHSLCALLKMPLLWQKCVLKC